MQFSFSMKMSATVNIAMLLLLVFARPGSTRRGHKIDLHSKCDQPKIAGFCMASFPRWFYSEVSQRCEQFIYGGCGGNGNRFRTKEECEASCSKTRDVCHLSKEAGPCRAYYRRFHYNTESHKCELFIYGGCRGNGNNFKSLSACEDRCDNPCLQPIQQGPCFAHIRKYYYDKTTGRCRNFTWGGCFPNSNNFATHDDCRRRCERQCRGRNCQLSKPLHRRQPYSSHFWQTERK